MILSQALPVLASVVAANIAHQRITIAPVPGGVRISARADTGLAVAIMVDMAAPSPGAIEVGVKALAECVSKMGAVSLGIEKGALVVSVGKSKVRIPMVDGASEDVAEADGVAHEVDRESLSTAMGRAVLAACPDITRSHIHGLIFDGSGNVVASNGHRLHLSRCDGAPEMWTVPLASVRTIVQALDASEGEVTVRGGCFNDGRATVVSFEVGRTMIRTPMIGDHILPWRQVLPSYADVEPIRVSARAFTDALKIARMSRTVTEYDRSKGEPGIVLESVKGALRMTSGGGMTEAECPCEGTIRRVAAMATYLSDAVNSLGGDDIEIRNGGELDPIEFRRGDEVRIVMPVRT